MKPPQHSLDSTSVMNPRSEWDSRQALGEIAEAVFTCERGKERAMLWRIREMAQAEMIRLTQLHAAELRANPRPYDELGRPTKRDEACAP